MTRAAGDSDSYELAILNGAGESVGRHTFLPSVTTILDSLPKHLEWWGYKLGLDAAQAMSVLGEDLSQSTDDLYERAKELGRNDEVVTPRNTLARAGGRGTDVHHAIEQFFRSGRLPQQEMVKEEHRGYVRGFIEFWDKHKDDHEVVAVEVPVYCLHHLYGGTLDLILKNKQTNLYHVVDFKTGKSIYESALLQVTAYEHAARDLAYVPESAATNPVVVRLTEKGKHETQTSYCNLRDFLAVKGQWEVLQRLNGKGQ